MGATWKPAATVRHVRHRAEPASHRRLVPPAHGAEDAARAVSRRGAGPHRSAARRAADPVRQPLPVAAAGAGRQAERPRRHERGTLGSRPGPPDHGRKHAGAAARLLVSSWFCTFYNQGKPPAAVASLNALCRTFLDNAEVKTKLAAYGARPDYGTPDAFRAFVQSEIAKFAGIIQREGLQMDVN